jgi:hypothetical protein
MNPFRPGAEAGGVGIGTLNLPVFGVLDIAESPETFNLAGSLKAGWLEGADLEP